MVSESSDLTPLLHQRRACLEALDCEAQPKRDLVDTLDIPRSTLDDIVRNLEDAGLVEYRDGEWEPTVLGRCALKLYVRYEERLESLAAAAPVTESLPSETPLGCQFLVGADVHTADPSVPDEVLRVLFDSVESATRVRGVTPVALAGHADTFYESVTNGPESRLEMVLPPAVLERLESFSPDATGLAREDERVDLYTGDVPIAFSLWIADDDRAGVVVYADRGVRGIITNDTPEAIGWATNRYERFRTDADPVGSGGGPSTAFETTG